MRYETGDKQLIKEMNRSSILRLILDQEVISRADIAKTLGLTPATISAGIADLIRQGIVREAGFGLSNGGRKPVLVELDDTCAYFIGVDISKDGVRAAIVNIKGKIIDSVERSFSVVDDDLKDHVNAAIHDVRGRGKVEDSKLYGIGIGMHGVVDIKKELTVFVPSMGLRNVVIKPFIEKEHNMPVIIDNDANAMAVGERWFGNARNFKDFIFVNAGKGIGAGIIIGDQNYYGKNYAAGEIGHIRVSDNNQKCVCGKYGCLDTVATENSLIKDVRQELNTGIASMIPELAGGDLAKITLHTIIEAADLGDKVALLALEKVGRYIGVALSYVINILNPERVIVGGSLSLAGDYIMKPLLESAYSLSMSESIDGVSILPSALGADAGVIGAASMVIRQYVDEVAKAAD